MNVNTTAAPPLPLCSVNKITSVRVAGLCLCAELHSSLQNDIIQIQTMILQCK